MKKVVIIALCILVPISIIFGLGISYSNKEITLRSMIKAQQEVCESFYDKMWKIISQKASIAQEYKNTFKEVYPDLIAGRYGDEKGGTLMKWITESNPNFDVTLYRELSQSIEAERTGFFMEQKKLIDINNEHRILLKKFPSSLFLSGREEIKITLVTSDKTDEVFKTGKENDINLFNK